MCTLGGAHATVRSYGGLALGHGFAHRFIRNAEADAPSWVRTSENLPTTASYGSIEPKGIVNVQKPIPKACAKVKRICRTKNEWGDAPYLFGVSFSSVKRYARG